MTGCSGSLLHKHTLGDKDLGTSPSPASSTCLFHAKLSPAYAKPSSSTTTSSTTPGCAELLGVPTTHNKPANAVETHLRLSTHTAKATPPQTPSQSWSPMPEPLTHLTSATSKISLRKTHSYSTTSSSPAVVERRRLSTPTRHAPDTLRGHC